MTALAYNYRELWREFKKLLKILKFCDYVEATQTYDLFARIPYVIEVTHGKCRVRTLIDPKVWNKKYYTNVAKFLRTWADELEKSVENST